MPGFLLVLFSEPWQRGVEFRISWRGVIARRRSFVQGGRGGLKGLVQPILGLMRRTWFALVSCARSGTDSWFWRRRGISLARVRTLKDGYIRNVPLPRVPRIQSTSTPATLTSRDVFSQGKHLPPYSGIPVQIPTLRRVIGPAIARVRTPW